VAQGQAHDVHHCSVAVAIERLDQAAARSPPLHLKPVEQRCHAGRGVRRSWQARLSQRLDLDVEVADLAEDPAEPAQLCTQALELVRQHGTERADRGA
jgi:hypothetical protein